jgi:hypothetical protein
MRCPKEALYNMVLERPRLTKMPGGKVGGYRRVGSM